MESSVGFRIQYFQRVINQKYEDDGESEVEEEEKTIIDMLC